MQPTLDFGMAQEISLYLTAFFGAFLSALWLSIIFWTYRDIRSRSEDRLIHFFAALIAAVLFLPGLIIYLILRPQRTLEEVYQHTLEEEALLSSIEERRICPGCGAHARPEWQLCPHCHTRLRKSCERCGRLMELPWQVCPYCGALIPGMRFEESTDEIEASASNL